jgi:hypothetical protein
VHTRLDPDVLEAALSRIERSHRAPRPPRSTALFVPPTSTLRVSARWFRHDSVHRAGARALRLLQSYAPDSVILAKALRLPGWDSLPTDPGRVDLLLERLDAGAPDLHPTAVLAHDVYRRVIRRLQLSPVQDLRIDFYDAPSGTDHEQDSLAQAVATEVALAMREETLGPQNGVRLPPLVNAGSLPRVSASRALRTLDVFLSTLIDRAGGLPDPFLVSLPELTHEDQVSAAAHICGTLEARLGLPRGTLRFELGLGDPVVIFEESGVCRLPTLVGASGGRCDVVRIDASSMARALGARDGAAAAVARDLVRLSVAGLGIPISWGTSPDLPRSSGGRSSQEPPHRFGQVHAAWRAHAETVTRAIREGYAWGWDHDAGQIPARLAAVGAHYRQLLPALRQEVQHALSSPTAGAGAPVFDEVRIGLSCGALSLEDLAGTGFEGT